MFLIFNYVLHVADNIVFRITTKPYIAVENIFIMQFPL